MKRILITGSSGFIGKTLLVNLINSNYIVHTTSRNNNKIFVKDTINFDNIAIDSKTNWTEALNNVDCIIHCAGIAHKIKKKHHFDNDIYNIVNVEGTRNLAYQAAEVGVRRLIFLSSIKVNRESTVKKNETNFFLNTDIWKTDDHYAISKLKAEKVLWEISDKTDLEIVIVRLPLVYGYGAKGNLARLIKLVKSGIPMPLGFVKNQRSMIGIDNLADLLDLCIDHPEASGKTFLASDGKDLSTPELIKLIALSMEKKASLFPVPIFLLKFLGSIFGKREEIDRLVGSLRIDNSYTKEILNWTPPLSVEEGIRRMVQGK